MSAVALLLGLLNVAVYCAIIVLVALVIVYALKLFGVVLDANVMKWGQIVVALLCVIAVVRWLFTLLP